MEISPALVLSLIGIFCNCGLGLYIFISNKNTAKDKELQDTQRRVTVVEERVRNMPDHADIAEMSGDIKALKEQVAGLKELIAPLAKTVDRVNDYLLNHKD